MCWKNDHRPHGIKANLGNCAQVGFALPSAEGCSSGLDDSICLRVCRAMTETHQRKANPKASSIARRGGTLTRSACWHSSLRRLSCLVRHSWHLRDHVPVIRRLKWGSFPYANLRYAPGERLQWSCGKRTTSGWKDISCNWVGLKTRPNGMAPLREDMISIRNKDEWQDSMELNSVSSPSK